MKYSHGTDIQVRVSFERSGRRCDRLPGRRGAAVRHRCCLDRQLGAQAMSATIGTTSRDGLLQITETVWDSNGSMRVTVRELIGGPAWGWTLSPEAVRERARRLARRALPEYCEGQTRSARTVRHFYAEGTYQWTFKVSRNEPV